MAERPTPEFGKRKPVAIATAQPVKRSSHVLLLLMGTAAIGGGAFALMPRENCQPTQPGMAAPSGLPTSPGCSPRTSSYSGGHGSSGWSWHSNFYGSDSASNRSASGTPSDSASGGVTRGGFGSFARAFSAHFSGGG